MLKWEDPPEKRVSALTDEILDELRTRPHCWALIASKDGTGTYPTSTMVRRHPEYEFVQRMVKKKRNLYGRFHPSSQALHEEFKTAILDLLADSAKGITLDEFCDILKATHWKGAGKTPLRQRTKNMLASLEKEGLAVWAEQAGVGRVWRLKMRAVGAS
jgi:hypothetical protein